MICPCYRYFSCKLKTVPLSKTIFLRMCVFLLFSVELEGTSSGYGYFICIVSCFVVIIPFDFISSEYRLYIVYDIIIEEKVFDGLILSFLLF